MQSNIAGIITVITGPMKCGKSDELIRIVKKYEIAGRKYLAFKPKQDTRDKNYIYSRSGAMIAPYVYFVNNLEEIKTIINEQNKPDLIIIDELHFFKDDNFVLDFHQWAADGIDIVVAGLDMSHLGNPLRVVADVMAIADHVIKLKAICYETKTDTACMTWKKNFSFNEYQVGDQEYEPVNRKIWFDKMKERGLFNG